MYDNFTFQCLNSIRTLLALSKIKRDDFPWGESDEGPLTRGNGMYGCIEIGQCLGDP